MRALSAFLMATGGTAEGKKRFLEETKQKKLAEISEIKLLKSIFPAIFSLGLDRGGSHDPYRSGH